jgi:hypothetical protein
LRALFSALALAGAFLTTSVFLLPPRAISAVEELLPEMQIKVDGELITLAKEDWDAVSLQADKILRSCAYDVGERPAEEWQEALAAASSVRLRYDVPVELSLPRRKIVVTDAIMTIADEHFIHQPLLFHEGQVNFVAKCDGLETIRFQCLPAMRDHFPPGYQRSCHILENY